VESTDDSSCRFPLFLIEITSHRERRSAYGEGVGRKWLWGPDADTRIFDENANRHGIELAGFKKSDCKSTVL
jgi:hypothetical protein